MSGRITDAAAAFGPDRRNFLEKAAAVPLAYLATSDNTSRGQTPDRTGPPDNIDVQTGLIMRQRQPDNFEFPFSALRNFGTYNEHFFIRNHFLAPNLETSSWKLRVEGAVQNQLELSFQDLRKLPNRSLTVTLECAGNSRVFLVPREAGVLWEMGAVGNARWSGAPLSAVLERAGLKDSAVEVVLEGADSGTVADPKSPGVIHFARSLPLDKARKPEVLLAYQMNGKPLPPAHGFPLRAVVAGWYGMASVKWLTRIIVTDRPFTGFYQTLDYSFFEKHNGLPTLKPITAMQVKAAIARPALLEAVDAGRPYLVFGAAWAGENAVAKVEVSTDSGKSWHLADLPKKPVAFAWIPWEYNWRVPREIGRYTLMARATDDHGRTQPMDRDPGRRNYMISHVLPVEVEVR